MGVLLSLALLVSNDVLWGNLGFGIYPGSSEKVAPNGLVYKPMFRLTADINAGYQNLYLFFNSAYYTEKPTPGVTTNKGQGKFDFTKRQYDFNVGVAYSPIRNFEVRFWAYSQSNINRGKDLNTPYGFKDGAASSLNYYLKKGRIRGTLIGGYYFTKELADTNGDPYKPSVFSEIDLSVPLNKTFSVFTETWLMTERPVKLKQMDALYGVAYRPYKNKSHNEFRLYLERDVGFNGAPERNQFILEYRRHFNGN